MKLKRHQVEIEASPTEISLSISEVLITFCTNSYFYDLKRLNFFNEEQLQTLLTIHSSLHRYLYKGKWE